MLLPIFSRRLWLPGITRTSTRFSGGVRDWIVASDWSPERSISKKHAVLLPHAFETLVDASIHDAITLAVASFESAAAISDNQHDTRSCAWQYISYYYAAYFAANALMRLSGHSCTNISASECSAINEGAFLYGFGGTADFNKITPGVYYCWTDNSENTPLHIQPVNAKGGAHIQFWAGFLRFLLDLGQSIKISTLPKADRDIATSELAELIAGLKHSGN